MTARYPLRLGMIGAGRWSKAYLRTAQSMRDVCTIVRVARRTLQPLEPPFDHVPVTSNWRAVLAAGDLDGLIVASPPYFHAEPAIAALEAGLPVLLEKPMTLNVAQAHAILDAARQYGVPALVDHTQTFHPAYRAIRAEMLHQPLRVESLSGAWGTFHTEYSSLWDWGAHDVAMALMLMGDKPSEIHAKRLEARKVDAATGELFRVELRFASGSSAVLQFGNILPQKTRRFLVGDGDHRLLYDDWTPPRLFRVEGSYNVLSPDAACIRALPCPEALPLDIVLQEFCERIIRRDASSDSVELGSLVVEVLAEAERQVGPA